VSEREQTRRLGIVPLIGPGPRLGPLRRLEKGQSDQPAIILELFSPLVAFGYHTHFLKTADGLILDTPGKASYDFPASCRIILILKTISKILERVITVRLSAITRTRGLLHPDQCGSLPRRSSSDACLTLMHEIKTLKRPRVEVSTLFLDIRAGFDNVKASTLRARLLASRVSSYMVDWVSSFLSERTCTLVFQGSPNISSPVSLGTPQGSQISALLFLLYVAPLHISVPFGRMVSYVDDFSITVASPSYRVNIGRLQGLFSPIAAQGGDIGVSFSVPKTELIPSWTPSKRTPPSNAAIELEGHLFRPSKVVRWLGYWFTPAFNTAHHYGHRLSEALCRLLLRQTPLLPRSRRQTLPLPSHCQWPPPPYTHLRSRPPNPGLCCAQRHERLLAQGPKMDHEQLFLHPHLHPLPGGLPRPHCLQQQIQEASRSPRSLMRLPQRQPGLSQTSAVLPLPLLLQGPRLDQAPYDRPHLGLPPSRLGYEGPQPPNEKTSPH